MKLANRATFRRLSGYGISPGYAVGTALRLESDEPLLNKFEIESAEVPAEVRRLKAGLKSAKGQLKRLRDKLEGNLGDEHALVLDAHILMLEDKSFVAELVQMISQRQVSAELAVKESAEKWYAIYRASDDEFFRERGRDFMEVIDRLIRVLSGTARRRGRLPRDVVLVSENFTLGMMADLDLSRVQAVVVSSGGWTSHAAIIARSFRIPVVAGVEGLPDSISTGQRVAIDGYQGQVLVEPTSAALARFRTMIDEELALTRWIMEQASGPSVTADGVPIRIEVNTEIPEEMDRALRCGAEGIGLYRSEFVFLRRKGRAPSEEEQYRIYRRLSEGMNSLPATIRTLDVGEERLAYIPQHSEELNPVLGLRGIRLGLKFEKLMRNQLTAILRANTRRNLQVVFPMISSVDEVVRARQILEDCAAALRARGVEHHLPEKVGIMLEVPAAVWAAELFAPLVDFFCVGTNDLLQYALAVDRTNENVAYLSHPLHPGVLRSLRQLLEVGQSQRIDVRFCGEMASSPLYCLVLLGMGSTHFSMNTNAIPVIKRLIRSVSQRRVEEKVQPLLDMRSPAEMRAYAEQELEPLLPEEIRQLSRRLP